VTATSAAAAVLLLAVPSVAFAQSAPPAEPRGFVQIAPMIVGQQKGKPNFRVHPPFGGVAPGVSLAAGLRVAKSVAVEGEVVVAGTISAPQYFAYSWRKDYVSESRDLLVGANVRYSPGQDGSVEIFGGGGLAISHFANRSIVRTDYPTKITSERDEEETTYRPMAGVGVALNIAVGRRVSILPTAGFHWIWRKPLYGLGAYMGTSPLVLHAGVAVRFQ
jgi:hypothetical protein